MLPHLSADNIGLFVFPDGTYDFVVATNTLDKVFAGLEENLPSEQFLPLWGGELTTASIWRRHLINIGTTKSSLMGSPTRCSQVRHRLVGP